MARRTSGRPLLVREWMLRLTLFAMLSPLLYTMREYRLAMVLLALAAFYFLATGLYGMKRRIREVKL